MTKINKLLQTYYTPDGKDLAGYNKKHYHERYTGDYAKKENIEKNLRYRHGILSDLLQEVPFTLTPLQIQQIRYWITTFNPYWKQFHRQARDETIVLAFIMIQQKNANPRLQIENYSICETYKLNTPKFNLIQNRLIFMLMKTIPVTYNQARYVNHVELMKGEQR